MTLSQISEDGGKVKVLYGEQEITDSTNLFSIITSNENKAIYVYLEGVEPGTVTLKFQYGTDSINIASDVALVNVTTGIDVDVDSDNTNTIDNSDYEDDIESAGVDLTDLKGNYDKLGKIIILNNIDNDSDGIPDFADGMNLRTETGYDSLTCAPEALIPVNVQFDDIDLSDYYFQFVYCASNPQDVEIKVDGTFHSYSVPKSGFRLWKTNSATRNPVSIAQSPTEGHFIPATEEDEYITAEMLNPTKNNTYYLEAVPGIEKFDSFSLSIKMFKKDENDEYVQVSSDSVNLNPVESRYEAATGLAPVASTALPVRGMSVSADVLVYNQELQVNHTLFAIPGKMLTTAVSQTYRSASIETQYRSSHPQSLLLGPGWSVNFDAHFYKMKDYYIYHGPDGREDIMPVNDANLTIPHGYSWKVDIEDSGNRLIVNHTDGAKSTYQITITTEAGEPPCKLLNLVRYEDRFGNSLQYVYDTEGSGKLDKIVDDAGREYDVTISSKLDKIESPDGKTYTYAYTAEGLLESVTLTSGTKTSIVKYVYADGYISEIHLDGKKYISTPGGKEITSMTFGYGADTLSYLFNQDGGTTEVTDTNQVKTAYSFDRYSKEYSLAQKTIRNPDGKNITTEFDYYDTLRLKETILPLKEKVSQTYQPSVSETDRRGSYLVKSTTKSPGAFTNPNGGVDGNSVALITTSAVYDPAKFYQITSSTNEENVTSTYSYRSDAAKTLEKILTPKQGGGSAETGFEYYANGLLKKQTNPDSSTVSYVYSHTAAGSDVTATAIAGGKTITSKTTYDLESHVKTETKNSILIVNNNYTEFGELDNSSVLNNGDSKIITDYEYIDSGNNTGMVEKVITRNPVATGTPSNPNYAYVTSTATFSYDGLNRQKSSSTLVNDETRTTQRVYVAGKNLIDSEKGEDNKYSKYLYDFSVAWLTQSRHKLANAGQDTFAYPAYKIERQNIDAYGRAGTTVRTSGTKTISVSSSYDWLGRNAKTINNTSGIITEKKWNDKTQFVNSVTKYSSGTKLSDSTLGYYANGDLQTSKNNITNKTETYSFDVAANKSTVNDILGKDAVSISNAFGELTKSSYDSLYSVASYDANANFKKGAVGNSEATADTNLANAVVYTTNVIGKTTDMTVPDLNNATTKIAPSGYGPAGSVEDPGGTVDTVELTETGTVKKVDEASGTSDSRNTDSNIKVTDRTKTVYRNGQGTKWIWNEVGQLIKIEYYYNAASVDQLGALGAFESVVYDDYGRIDEYTKRDTTKLKFEYYAITEAPEKRGKLHQLKDGNGLLVKDLSDYNILGLPQTIIEYSTPGSTDDYIQITQVYHTSGEFFGMIQSETTEVFEGNAQIAPPRTLTFTHDATGKRKGFAYPAGGPELTYNYKNEMFLNSIISGTDTILDIDFDAGHPIPSAIKLNNAKLTMNLGYKSKNLGLISDISIGTDYAATFGYEKRGLKSATGQWVDNADKYNRTYQHGRLYRLAASHKQTGDKFSSESFDLDQFENRRFAVVDGLPIDYTVSDGNKYASVSAPGGLATLLGSANPGTTAITQPTVTSINFQPDTSAVPNGFESDTGLVYNPANAPTHGFTIDSTGEAVDRESPDYDTEFETFISLQPGTEWKINLANKLYRVKVVAGDPSQTTAETFKLAVNGDENNLFMDELVDQNHLWADVSGAVKVTDGTLTLSIPAGATAVKLAFIQITEYQDFASTSFGYDGKGNMKEDSHFSFGWNNNDRIEEITDKFYDAGNSDSPTPQKVKYTYDAMGRRILVRYEGEGPSYNNQWKDFRVIYDGVVPIQEEYLDGSGIKARYVYSSINCLIQASIDTDHNGTLDTIYLPILDDRGTLIGVADANGVLIEKLYYNSTGLMKSYDANGVENLGSDGNNLARSKYLPFGWTGMYKDPFTGLYHTHFREYDPIHGRWLSEDPAGYRDGLNLYAAYMGVNGIDYLGCDVIDIGKGLAYDTVTQSYFSFDPAKKQAAVIGLGRNYLSTKEVAYGLENIAKNNPFYNMSNVPFYLNPGMFNGTSLYVLGDKSLGVLPYALTVMAIPGEAAAGAGLIFFPEATGITKAGGIILMADAVDRAQALFSGKTGFERMISSYGTEDSIQTSMMIKEGSILVLLVGTSLPKSWQGKQLFSGASNSGNKFWAKSVEFQGNKVFQRNDLFDPQTISSWKVKGKTATGTNIERMLSGRAPIGFDGKAINLHHLTQRQASALAEISQAMHQQYYKVIHINTGTFPSGIDRPIFNTWKSGYWINRASGF